MAGDRARHRPRELSGGALLIDLADRAVELRDGRIVDGTGSPSSTNAPA